MYNLKEMFVRKNHKGMGIGSRLMADLERELIKQGTTSMTLFTSHGDLTEKFYKKNGFVTDDEMIMMGKLL